MVNQVKDLCGGSTRSSGWFVYFGAITASLTSFEIGACFVWASPFIRRFLSDDVDNPLGRPATQNESAWIVSAYNLGMIFGPFISMIILRYVTKKTMLLIAMAHKAIAFSICIFASDVYVFIGARFLMGLGTGCVYSSINPFIGEIAEDNIRGALGLFPGTATYLGNLYSYVIGPYVTMTWFSVALLVPLVAFFVAFGYFVPDSPYDLLMKNHADKAKESLRRLRGRDDIDGELSIIKATIESRMSEKIRPMDILRDYETRKALMYCIILMIIQQFAGIGAIVSYAEVIFRQTANLIPPSLSAISLALGGLVGNIGCVLLVDKFGRKLLLTTSCALLTPCLIAVGAYFYLYDHHYDVSSIYWLPTVSLLLFVASHSFGMSTTPWLLMGELFHPKVKPFTSTIASLTACLCSFTVSLSFPFMLSDFGMTYTCGSFAFVTICGILFCSLLLPETKCKSFQEIQCILGRGKRKTDSSDKC
ncbi:facilitated trehalose transporter Tret1-like [Anthonomus grandis grandis]|uniref:facilitated trehalose transporter Tret1-like n=1 Tax=Anthonomus grandis grandis TaxID=2921223 RepID=UPI0021657F2F|nr:facilitated trehalose transporter Tret1-like [Anthonomus grandis grandis]